MSVGLVEIKSASFGGNLEARLRIVQAGSAGIYSSISDEGETVEEVHAELVYKLEGALILLL